LIAAYDLTSIVTVIYPKSSTAECSRSRKIRLVNLDLNLILT